MTNDARLLRRFFDVAVETADPAKTIPAHLPPKPAGRLVVIGAGKASARMAEIVEREWGPCEGLVITRYGYGRPTEGIEIVEAAHPVPDAEGIKATQRMMALVQDLGDDDLVLALISGGASSLLCAPAEGMTLEDKQAVHHALLQSGAPIGAMNLIRKHLSASKGGQLAAAVYPAKLLTLTISDVPGDDPAEIGSGPTVGETTTAADALAAIEAHQIALPEIAMQVLQRGSQVVAPDDARLQGAELSMIAAPSQSLAAAAALAQQEGCEVRMLGDALEGEAQDLARAQIEMALQIQGDMTPDAAPVVLMSGGECTVTGAGAGIGGPNSEFTLASAVALDGTANISVIACDTDGVDGAAEVAGAIADGTTVARAQAQGLDPNAALAQHDSHTFFGELGDQVVCGPTLTNVNDFRAILIRPI